MSDLKTAAEIIGKFAEAMKVRVEQIDTVLVENHEEVAFWAYAANPHLDFPVPSARLPMRLESEGELLHREWSSALMAMLPQKQLRAGENKEICPRGQRTEGR